MSEQEYEEMLCKPKPKKKNKTNKNQDTRNFKVLAQAANQIGTLEWKNGSNPKVEEYLDWGYSEENTDTSLNDSTPWCAGYIAWCLEKVGMGSTNSLMARSYEKWGISSKNSPLPGDIVTFWRKSKTSGFGHVGFFIGFERPNKVLVLGGNQNDQVNVTAYSTGRLVDIRRSSKAGTYTPDEIREILVLAENIKAGVKVDKAGSVV